jgi:hypothetical protein
MSQVEVDPRLAALALRDEIAVEFPEGTVEPDPVVPADEPEVPVPAARAPEPAAPPAPEPAAQPAPVEHAPLRLEPSPEPPVAELEESEVLLTTSVVRGLVPRVTELTLERLGFRLAGPAPLAVRWSDVTRVDVGLGYVNVRTKRGTARMAMAIDGVAAPELNAGFARVIDEARGGAFEPDGSAVHELQNGLDAVRDTFHSSDDPFIPLAMGGALTGLAAVLALALPEILAFLTRPAVPANAFVLGSRLGILDPRVIFLAVTLAAVATAAAARAALGAHAASWARGTLRGWHIERPSPLAHARKVLALAFLYPAIGAAAALIALAAALPSARSHATVDPTGIAVVRPLPMLDRAAGWSEVGEIVTLAASGSDHPHGVAALVRARDGSSLVSTLELPLRNATDRYFLELTRKWHAQAGGRSGDARPRPGDSARSH